ncbi:MAG: hypothetical protein K2P63_14065 [Lachnospiraceae bacterium]|nr:hypothetical protein [Lachnospiraceae bacterium]
MKKIIIIPILLLIFSLTACGAKKEKVSLDALEKNGALISTAAPCSTVDEVRKAKIPLGNAPFDSQSDEERGLESVTYLVQDEKFSLSLAGYEMKNSLFQFINGKLSNITMNLTDSGSYEAVKTELTRLYGEPATEEPAEGIVMNVWEFQADYPVRAAVIGYGTDGKIVSGSFQVSYIWFGTED